MNDKPEAEGRNSADIEMKTSVIEGNNQQANTNVQGNQNQQVGGQPQQHPQQLMLGPDGRPINYQGQIGGPGMMGGPGQQMMLGPDGRPIMHMQGGPGPQMMLGPDGRPIMQPNMMMRGPGMMQPGPGYQGGPGMMQPGPGMMQPNQMRGPGPGMNQPYLGPNQGGNQGMANPKEIPTSGRFAPTQVTGSDQDGTYAATQECWGSCCGCLATYVCPCCCSPPYQTVPQGFTGIIQRFGKFYKLVPPGMHYLNPDLDTLVLVDKRERVQNLTRQRVVSRDNVSTVIDAVLYFRVADSYKSKFAVTNLEAALVDLVQTALRNVIGGLSLQEMLEDRDAVSERLMEHVTKPAFAWGTEVTRVLVQDIFLPEDQRANMSQGAIAKKIAEAKVIQSQADVEAARLMREAAQILSTEAAMQIRFVESLENLSKTGNPKMVFFPADYREIGSMNEHLLQ
eukprot:CAMPEP_0176456092 /NCGR_PEP_ID=MMETSP0127-20121128/31065_1 /TAXON_ID=938130 /ORGANISM="Platyophrya macrostoma, Strain WH" /LENGTH=451 /DNA_ID=CAMNT_0017845951 /DNA_START=20 /DNA_END=1378 /DNA_ORIENTATION=+